MIKLLSIIGIILIGIKGSWACKCEEPESVEESFRFSDAVFHGKVVSLSFVSYSKTIETTFADSIRRKLDEKKLNLFDSDFILKVEFEITKCYKGNFIGDTITIYTTRTSASCGYQGFEIGKDYIVYGSKKSYAFWPFKLHITEHIIEQHNVFWTNQCTRTNPYNYVESIELEQLME